MSDEEYTDICEDFGGVNGSGSDSDSIITVPSAHRHTPPSSSEGIRSTARMAQELQQILAPATNRSAPPPPGGIGGVTHELQRLLDGSNGSVPAGDISGVTKLYQHDCQSRCCPPRWSGFRTLEDEEADLEKRLVDQPIVHRHDRISGKWVTQSFTVQCSVMRGILGDALRRNTRIWTWTSRTGP